MCSGTSNAGENLCGGPLAGTVLVDCRFATSVSLVYVWQGCRPDRSFAAPGSALVVSAVADGGFRLSVSPVAGATRDVILHVHERADHLADRSALELLDAEAAYRSLVPEDELRTVLRQNID